MTDRDMSGRVAVSDAPTFRWTVEPYDGWRKKARWKVRYFVVDEEITAERNAQDHPYGRWLAPTTYHEPWGDNKASGWSYARDADAAEAAARAMIDRLCRQYHAVTAGQERRRNATRSGTVEC